MESADSQPVDTESRRAAAKRRLEAFIPLMLEAHLQGAARLSGPYDVDWTFLEKPSGSVFAVSGIGEVEVTPERWEKVRFSLHIRFEGGQSARMELYRSSFVLNSNRVRVQSGRDMRAALGLPG